MNLAHDLYGTIPQSNHLGLFADAMPNYKGILSFLDFTKEDLSKATGVPRSSIRDGDRMPKELQDRLLEIATVCELVAEYFKGDIEKSTLWFKMPNPSLGDVSPRDMIRLGRFHKLLKFIYDARKGY